MTCCWACDEAPGLEHAERRNAESRKKKLVTIYIHGRGQYVRGNRGENEPVVAGTGRAGPITTGSLRSDGAGAKEADENHQEQQQHNAAVEHGAEDGEHLVAVFLRQTDDAEHKPDDVADDGAEHAHAVKHE